MNHRRLRATAYAVISLSLVAGVVPATAQGFGDGTILVSPGGRIIRDIPEMGSVRSVIDVQGRELLLNSWDEVIAIRMTRGEYRREFGYPPRLAERDPRWEHPGGYPSDMPPSVRYPITPLPEPGYDRDGYGYRDYRDDGYGNAPRASIERRDLNPETATIPDADDAIDPASPLDDQATGQQPDGDLSKAQITALQVFLDRAGMSPGVIDGRMGSNVQKALDAYEEATGERLDPKDGKLLERLASGDGLAFTTYEITSADAAGPYVASIPSDYGEKAKLERLSYTSTIEMLAEKFHMDEDYLRSLNPEADFSRPGTIIKVVAPGAKEKGKITRIVADKGKKQVRGYDINGNLLVAYPATIGSSDTPSPSGTMKVERIAHDPGYTYNPKINFKQGDNDKVLEIPPGPNGPVGNTWIALSKPTYGIHGTPEPSKIGKTASHGCVRLTNWDANELASMVEPGVFVSFIE